ncbi:uncharacterized protein [Chironomus tepperi]|uniref:uncharacterized protein n=1 Tax=Chironomus tepperi TaxID=113505 RepID=UPI00391F874A
MMENHAFVADHFDNLKTLQRKERTLLGDMKAAFIQRDLKEFTALLHRTGYKNGFHVDYEIHTNKLRSCMHLQKFKTTRNLLFERDESNESLFEEILAKQGKGVSNFIGLIWSECELWRNQNILTQSNTEGKQLIDYVIQSNDDGNLFAFLVFDFEQESESILKTSKNYFLKLKNSQYNQKTGKSLFQKIYSTIDSESENICYDIIKKLLKEMQIIVDIQGETAINDVLNMENEVYKHKILKILLTYWKIFSKEYSHFKAVFLNISPYYNLFLTLKEGHEFEFEELFPKYLDSIRAKNETSEIEDIFFQEDCNSLLEFALQNGQRRAISALIDNPAVDPNKVFIKIDESSFDNQNANFLMSKLLERGYYLGNVNNGKHVPADWISPQVFGDFLDSKVKEDGISGCKCDYNFLIDPKIRNENIKGDHDDNGRLLFSSGLQSLERILESKNLRTFITHPVLSTFINLKVRKYRQIFNLNFFIFIALYMIPFFLLLTLIPFDKFYMDIFEEYGEPYIKNNKTHYKLLGMTRAQLFELPYYACCFATIYITLRECLQLFVVCNSFKDYFKKKSNQFEIIIIGLSGFILYGMKFFLAIDTKTLLTIPSAFIIIFATVELLSILPYPSMSIYMFMLKQVTKTFLKFFTIFIVIIIAFTFSFCIVLKPPISKSPSPWSQLRRDWRNYIERSNNTSFEKFKEPAVMFVKTLEDALEDNETIFRNFENPFTSFQKTLLIFSGEYSIEPYTLDSISKQILFLLFVFTSIILFNLINGLAINDIQQLKEHAEFLNLKQQIRNASECEGVLCNVYWKVCRTSKPNSWWRKCVMFIMTLLIRKYPYLHKMDNLCIDFKRKTVKYEWDHKQTHILRTFNGGMKRYTLDEETINEFREIIEKRHSTDEGVNEKVENLQNEVKKLKLSLKCQHEEMKKLIEELLLQKS